ncbi:hypothetical protein BD770DRAFT_416714 [Pilaira anomala]|nr:hypothetical protein BD770DRAFT_416714 [Pilaira anomala]
MCPVTHFIFLAYIHRYFIKVIGDIGILEKAIKNYDYNWTLNTFMDYKTPLMASVSGSMVQQEVGHSFLGPTLEEKFHVKCSSLSILPCLPLVPEVLKNRVHTDVSPSMLNERIKSGYYLVNLSLNQAFGEPEFSEIHPDVYIYTENLQLKFSIYELQCTLKIEI